ncbi:TonB-dependent receptor [Brevundimonas kwangchunensis]|uniref:TonB-dependent receptor n=1 Tax=Brevundimonas kwangchunensis TaxID=322163 RepID=A0ABN1GLU0_9CAUL
MNVTELRSRLLGSTMIAGLTVAAASLALASAAQAQSAPQDEASRIDDVVVTGSRIARQDYAATVPIVTVDEQDFQATGSVTIDTLTNDLPQFVPAVSSTSNNPSNGGQANLDLRGLGTNRTLVLMNGRRIIPSNANGTVDVNLIPSALIRSVEVISGGASATYGSDALAGVANFILNTNFEGIRFDAQYGVTDRDDGVTQSYSVSMGGDIADGRGHALFSISRSLREKMFNSSREFSSISGRSGASPLGNTVFDASNLPSQAAVDGYFGGTGLSRTQSFGFNDDGSLFAYEGVRNYKSPGGIDFDGFAVPGTDYGYNTGALNYLQLPLERWNTFAAVSYELTDNIEAYGELLMTDYQSGNELAASPAAGSTGFRVPVTNPFITPDLAALLATRPNPLNSFRLDKRFTDVGGRNSMNDYGVYQGTFGFRGDIPGVRDWTYDIYAQYGRQEVITTQSGNVSRSAVQRLLDAPDGGRSLCAGGFDFLGLSRLSPECVRYIGRSAVNTTVQEQTVVEASMQGGLFTLPAGEVRFAYGLQYREDTFAFRPDASLAQTNPIVTRPDGGTTGGSEIAGFNPSQALVGATNSTEAFLELLVPVVSDLPFIQQLDLNLGYRAANFDTVGLTSSYKAEIDWLVVDGLRIRSGVQRAVRAPSIGELYAPAGTTFGAIGSPTATGLGGDPCDRRSSYRTGPNAAQVTALCTAQAAAAGAPGYSYTNAQVSGIASGNPDLTEETADSFTIGAVLSSQAQSPWFSGMSASLDYYSIEIADVIAPIASADQIQSCFNANGQNPTYDPNNEFCRLFSRDPLSGNIFNATERNDNLTSLKTSGIDMQVDWRVVMEDVGLPAWGNLSLNVIVGWLESRERQSIEGGTFVERVGTIDVNSAGQTQTFPEWKSLTSLNWSNGDFGAGFRWRFVDEMTVFNSNVVLDATSYFDMNANWNITESVSLRGTVNNITDEQPQTWVPGVQANTDPSTYDILGRRFSIGLTAKF